MKPDSPVEDLTPFERTIAPVRAKFVNSLGRHLQDLEALTATMKGHRDHSDALIGISEIAHRIRGVAKTLGFGELGEIAGVTETAVDKVLGRALTRGETDAVLRKVHGLMTCIAATRS